MGVALKPGVDKVEGYWFGGTKAGGSFENYPYWTFSQSSIIVDEFSSDGRTDCNMFYTYAQNNNLIYTEVNGKSF